MLTRGSAIATATVTVLALALAGCSAGDDGKAEPTDEATVGVTISDPPPSSASSASSVPSSPAASPSTSDPAGASPSASVTGQGRTLVAMTITGGFAGVDREVILRGDGTVRTTDRGGSGVRRTSAAEFARLRALLADPALDKAPAFSLDGGAADKFRYTLQFDGRTITTDRTSDSPALKRLIDALEKWLPKS
ncbi:hypothetical protein KMT30_41220 [Streptomyces sp. IBSBF 2953]|uniref:hypothetical protein n=1 Tax=Streptomyces TaxID=1883 RepID=UPI00211A8982|nr:hypothetical protein [Streptomyces scabiei]MCQ9185338.1 hypothetical protein [Streptomyces hayashii]MDX3118871.1 hypothetical protein [Streptomyces scabiei]